MPCDLFCENYRERATLNNKLDRVDSQMRLLLHQVGGAHQRCSVVWPHSRAREQLNAMKQALENDGLTVDMSVATPMEQDGTGASTTTEATAATTAASATVATTATTTATSTTTSTAATAQPGTATNANGTSAGDAAGAVNGSGAAATADGPTPMDTEEAAATGAVKMEQEASAAAS